MIKIDMLKIISSYLAFSLFKYLKLVEVSKINIWFTPLDLVLKVLEKCITKKFKLALQF